MRFKAKNGRAIDGRDIYLWDERDQVTSQSFMVVVHSVVVFGYGRLLEKVDEFWDLLLRHFCGATSWRRGGYHCRSFCPRFMPRVIGVGRRSNGSNWCMNSHVSHGAVNGEGNGR
jgi:hypothetical protein